MTDTEPDTNKRSLGSAGPTGLSPDRKSTHRDRRERNNDRMDWLDGEQVDAPMINEDTTGATPTQASTRETRAATRASLKKGQESESVVTPDTAEKEDAIRNTDIPDKEVDADIENNEEGFGGNTASADNYDNNTNKNKKTKKDTKKNKNENNKKMKKKEEAKAKRAELKKKRMQELQQEENLMEKEKEERDELQKKTQAIVAEAQKQIKAQMKLIEEANKLEQANNTSADNEDDNADNDDEDEDEDINNENEVEEVGEENEVEVLGVIQAPTVSHGIDGHGSEAPTHNENNQSMGGQSSGERRDTNGMDGGLRDANMNQNEGEAEETRDNNDDANENDGRDEENEDVLNGENRERETVEDYSYRLLREREEAMEGEEDDEEPEVNAEETYDSIRLFVCIDIQDYDGQDDFHEKFVGSFN